jgi:hypothetical protein
MYSVFHPYFVCFILVSAVSNIVVDKYSNGEGNNGMVENCIIDEICATFGPVV